jgi:hypothetical protein
MNTDRMDTNFCEKQRPSSFGSSDHQLGCNRHAGASLAAIFQREQSPMQLNGTLQHAVDQGGLNRRRLI